MIKITFCIILINCMYYYIEGNSLCELDVGKTCITVKGKVDGFGAQYNAIISGIAYSSYCNFEYCHVPMKKTGEHYISLSDANKIMGYDKGNNCSNRCTVRRTAPHKPE